MLLPPTVVGSWEVLTYLNTGVETGSSLRFAGVCVCVHKNSHLLNSELRASGLRCVKHLQSEAFW